MPVQLYVFGMLKFAQMGSALARKVYAVSTRFTSPTAYPRERRACVANRLRRHTRAIWRSDLAVPVASTV
jgi:hypothetical protein